MSPPSRAQNYLAAAEELRGNGSQWDAYESEGHCVVLAGPGSGKTKVLTTKMARMLAQDVRPPRGIACITYSNQCAKELKKRLDKIGIEDDSRVFIGTVHSFCFREVILPYAQLAGFDLPDPIAVATQTEQTKLFAKAVETVLDENPQYLRTPFDEFRRTVIDRTSPEWMENDRYAPVTEKYEELLRARGKVDFDDMALIGLRLIRDHDWVRKALKAKYPILLVDEYQDLGVPLHEIVLSLSFDAGVRLFAVGDPDQSIYGFTGARPELMRELASRDDVENVTLQLNYRCGQSIINASTVALGEEREFLAADQDKGVVLALKCDAGFDQQVQQTVSRLVPEALARRKGRKLGDIGILYLDQYQGKEIAEAAEAAGLKYVRFDNGNPYRRTPLILWLEECAAWCAGGWKLGDPRLSSLIRTWLRFHPSESRDSEIGLLRKKLVKFLFDTRDPDLALIEWVMTFAKSGLGVILTKDPSMTDDLEALIELQKICEKGKVLEKCTVGVFGGKKGSPDHLNLTTTHSAKGLEYDVVIMLGLEQGRLPNYSAEKNAMLLREERRKFYVAMTRARHEVHLLWSGWYVQKGYRFNKGRSMFVDEVMAQLGGTA